jgi:hypothetical protein
MTTEFDIFRQGAEKSAERYEEAGVLLDYGQIKGTTHAGALFPGTTRFDAYFTQMNVLVDNMF